MATTNLNFASQVAKWVEETKGGVEAVFRESTQRVFEEMTRTRAEGGSMPVDTGFLRASFMASTEAMPPINPKAAGNAGVTYVFNPGPVSLVINTAQVGETIFIGATANYAIFVNYGTSKMAAAMFVDLAAQRWPAIVKQVEEELAGRLGR